MADDHYSSKRKYDDLSPSPRRTGFSAHPPASPPAGGAPVTSSYNTVPPPPDEIQLAKQRPQEIAARLFSAAGAKRPRVDSVDDDVGGALGFSNSAGGGHVVTIPPLSSQGSTHQYSCGGYQSGSITKRIVIPNERVGFIIGKYGETIKHLKAQSGAKIQVTRDMDVQPGSKTRLVHLSGTLNQIIRAEELITEVLAHAVAGTSRTVSNRKYNEPQPGPLQFQMQIADNMAGLVIGKGGETIESMQYKSGARIQVIPLYLPPGDPPTERTLYIDGTADQIAIAKQLVSEVTSEADAGASGAVSNRKYKARQPGLQQFQLQITNKMASLVIGKGGKTIESMQYKSGARIQVIPSYLPPGDPATERTLYIDGTADQIKIAKQLVTEVTSEAVAGTSRTVSNRKYNAPQPGPLQFQMQIADNMAGLVIGKGGENIESMQYKSGARIQVIPLYLPPGDPPTERTLYIDGTADQIAIAKQLVSEVTSEANWGAPGAPTTQQPGYGYMQPGAYTGAPPQYSQPPYGSYPPAFQGYQSNQEPQQTPSCTGYDYYNQQQQPQQQPTPGTAAPADASTYIYSQPATYASQGYDDSTYSQQSSGQQAYGYSGYQTAYDQQSYATTGYGSAANSAQHSSAPSYGGPGGASQASLGKQASTSATGNNPGYSSQTPTGVPSSYPAQGSAPQSGYAAPQTQASYSTQPPAQGWYDQGVYGQPPQGQKPSTSAPYGQAPTTGSAQADYGAPPPYPGAPAASHPGYVQQQSYGDPYSSGSYGQPPQGQRPSTSAPYGQAPAPGSAQASYGQYGYSQPGYGAPPSYPAAPPPYPGAPPASHPSYVQ